MLETITETPLIGALIWMLGANIAALGPGWLRIAALVLMLISAGWLVPAVIRANGWLVGVPLMVLMGMQLRWLPHFVRRALGRKRQE